MSQSARRTLTAVADDHAAMATRRGHHPRHGAVHEPGTGARQRRWTSAPTSGRSACVLYEMLTGARAFPGETIVRHVGGGGQPRARIGSALPAATPPRLRRLLRALSRQRSEAPAARYRRGARRRSRMLLAGAARRRGARRGSRRSGRPSATWCCRGLATGAARCGAAVVLLVWAPWRKASPPAPLRLSAELGADVSLTFGFGDAVSLSPDGAVVAFVAQKGAARTSPALRATTHPTAGHAAVGDRRRRESVLFAGRPVDRVFRRRQAEEDRRHGRRGRHRCATRRTVAAARGARTARSCSRPTTLGHA